jgi:hypothetical protein
MTERERNGGWMGCLAYPTLFLGREKSHRFERHSQGEKFTIFSASIAA